MNPDFSKGGLVPAVVQDAVTGRVRMVGYMDAEAFGKTRDSGLLHLHSRSRGALWLKGETSGNLHPVRGLTLDCDRDAVLVSVAPEGPTCHTGEESCFGDAPVTLLERLEGVISGRRGQDPGASYTASLLARGPARAAQKVGEESAEVLVAALAESEERLVQESADLLYHLMVLWATRGVTLRAVLQALDERRGVSP